MVRLDVEYLGELHCKVTHAPSGNSFLTDAPLDNQGKAEYISPTDLTAASIASCIATTMGIAAVSRNIDIKGLKVVAQKEMAQQPLRRISAIYLEFDFPNELSDDEVRLFANIIKNCPVSRSLHPDVKLSATFRVQGKEVDISGIAL